MQFFKTSIVLALIAQQISSSLARTRVELESKLIPLHEYHLGPKTDTGHGRFTDHFYTTDFRELDGCRGKDGFVYKGIVAYVYQCPVVPLYRFFLQTDKHEDHFYSADIKELVSPVRGGFDYEGMEGCVFQSKKSGVTGLVPLYRYFLDTQKYKDHFLTTDMNILGPKGQEKFGYKFEGIIGYVKKIRPKDKFIMCDPFERELP